MVTSSAAPHAFPAHAHIDFSISQFITELVVLHVLGRVYSVQ